MQFTLEKKKKKIGLNIQNRLTSFSTFCCFILDFLPRIKIIPDTLNRKTFNLRILKKNDKLERLNEQESVGHY